MAFKGKMNTLVLVATIITMASAATVKNIVQEEQTLSGSGIRNPRLFFPTTGTGTADTSITVSSDFLALVSLAFLVLLGLLIIPALIGGGSLFAGSPGLSSFGASPYQASGTGFGVHDTGFGHHDSAGSSYTSIHRALDTAADKYD